MNMMHARRAYQITRQAMDPREQEADVFRRVTGALKAALEKDGIARARAIADNRRLWIALDASLRHPANQLPQDTKVTMIQVGRTVMREMENPAPDLAFLIEINEQLTSGLR
ncbi:MAG: flagellar biosynthesis regulator FlhF [Roseomonas sp.]|jgi:flagellar biosynthesis regulator FlaF|nr:flagellar biosynthesis regulator FlhF [Roseomonas sp.]MCA3312905.1 flagellar biosynthesis regulator FlhF [Roseomonas sp.]MCA3317827.1 flagellar biosynthesis regulator FlhF [Roseomonas sp.]MCA3343500.1 flagellar biosynthesis regulator FlhF [Roseomonas sp.]